MENNKLTLSATNKALSTQLKPQSPEMRTFIKKELGLLAIRFGQPMTDARLTLYAEDLQGFPQWKLTIAFNRLRLERKSGDFGFPLVGDIVASMQPAENSSENEEWQGLSVEEKRQAEKEWLEDQKTGFIAEIKDRLKAICNMPRPRATKEPLKEIREQELTPAEWEEKWHRHRLKTAEMMEKYGGMK
jgi:hypothetical protein